METADFMPSEAVIAGIRKDIEAYEADKGFGAPAGALAGAAVRRPGAGVRGAGGLAVQQGRRPQRAMVLDAACVPLCRRLRRGDPALLPGDEAGDAVAAIVPRHAAADHLRLHPGHALPAWRDAELLRPAAARGGRLRSTGKLSTTSFPAATRGFRSSFTRQNCGKGRARAHRRPSRASSSPSRRSRRFPGILVATRRANAVVGFFRGMFASKMRGTVVRRAGTRRRL